MSTESAFDAARSQFFKAQRAMEAAAIEELARIIHETHPDAVEAKVKGHYTEEGDLVVDLVGITTPTGTHDGDAVAEIAEDANDALLYLATTMSEGYLGTHEIGLVDHDCGACEDTGFLLNQEYGTADIPEGWTPVQACDACNRFETDEDAAIQAARDKNVGSTQYVSFSYFKAKPDPDDEGEDRPGDWAIHWKDGG